MNVEQMEDETAVPNSAVISVENTTAEFDTIESLVRLLVGGTIEAPSELVSRLKIWEAQVDETGNSGNLAALPAATDQLRYALVGLVFETQEQMRYSASRFGRLVNASAGRFLRAARPFTDSQAMRPVRRHYQTLVEQGETAVARWVERGQAEEPRSRLIAREAVNLTINDVIQQLAENPEVKELVMQQTTGIADDIVGGVRERTVTADVVLERLVRGLLRRPPRELLPLPSPKVMAQAEHLDYSEP